MEWHRAFVLAVLPLFLTGPGAGAQQLPDSASDPHLARALRVLTRTPLVDGHNDLPWAIRLNGDAPMDVEAYDLRRATPGQTDIPRLRAGHVGAQFWSVYVPASSVEEGAARMQLEEIDIARRMIARYPDVLEQAYSASDVERIFGAGKIASLLGVEGGHAIENSLGVLRTYYALGARYMTLTHGSTIDWADSGTDEARHGGRTEFGKEGVREMNRLGMLVDLSHTSPATMSDALDVSEAPVIFSHSSARALTDHPRNVPDSILRRVRENGGVVMVTFVPSFVNEEVRRYSEEAREAMKRFRERYGPDPERVRREMEAWREAHPAPRATLADVADHIEHVRDVAGVDHVGIGSDFDGITSTPVGLEDVSTYPALFAELSRRGWTEEDLAKLAGENLLRVMRRAEAVARRLQRERPPSTATIGELDGSEGGGG